MKILQPLKKFHFANPLQKSEIFDPLRKSRQRGGVYIKWNGPQNDQVADIMFHVHLSIHIKFVKEVQACTSFPLCLGYVTTKL